MEVLILSTRNVTKAVQIREVLESLPLNVMTLSEAGISGECVEDGSTLAENAMKKALFVRRFGPAGAWCLSDDTGLFIRALRCKPGIHAARWAGESATTDDITHYTLRKMNGFLDRHAKFVTVAALISPTGQPKTFSGSCLGLILNKPRGTTQAGMPYSPLFVPDGHSQTWSEMDTVMENEVSHRGKAFRQVANHLALAIAQSR